jgi:metal-sulfur cluster biosynthetic enzyme
MSEAEILEALRGVVDPEVGVDVVALGLVYEACVEDGVAHVTMTMTSRACPFGEVLVDQARAAVRAAGPHLRDVVVDLVFKPPWHPGRMSPAAKQLLGWGG